MVADDRITPYHVSIYMALLSKWQSVECAKYFYISRRYIMKAAKVNSLATYHKCIKELVSFGYIHYGPSYNPKQGSRIEFIDIHEVSI